MQRMLLVLCAVASCAAPRTDPFKRPTPADRFVRVEGGEFILNDRTIRILGVNVYSLGSRPEPHFTCGRVYQDAEVIATLEEIRALVPKPFVPAVRVMMFRNFLGPERDWSRYDLILSTARHLGIRIILTLDSHWGSCTGEGIHSPDWYRLEYCKASKSGLPSLRAHIREAALRYREESAILMWQVINEGQCEDPMALYAYAVDLTGLIRRTDPNHLISFGTVGDNQGRSGAEGSSYVMLHTLSSVDVIEAHEYPEDDDLTWSHTAIENCLETAELLGKPCLIGEMGMTAVTEAAKAERAKVLPTRISAMLAAGARGVLIWSYRSGDWQKDFDPSDPLYEAIKKGLLK